jgi:CRP-like cAMP-binding protein
LQEESESLKFFANLDSALEWVEESVLRRNGVRREDEALELAQIPFFRGMPQEMIWTLEKIMDVRDFKAGERLFSQNDPGDEMLFIRKGTVKVSMPLEGGERQYLATLQKGEILGEMAFLDKGTRSADAIAETNGSLFSLKRDKFNDLTSEHPEISSVLFKRLARELSQRLRRTHLELKAAEE